MKSLPNFSLNDSGKHYIIPSIYMAAKSSSYASKTEILQDCMAALKVGKKALAGQLLRQQRGAEPWPITV
jgi:hypothetical protein